MNYAEAMTRIHEAGASLAAARVEEAEAFLRHRIDTPSDNQAKARAVVETGGNVAKAEAEFEAARAYLQVAVAEIAREGHR